MVKNKFGRDKWQKRSQKCWVCGTKFKTDNVKIVYKELVECKKCGNMWVFLEEDPGNRFH